MTNQYALMLGASGPSKGVTTGIPTIGPDIEAYNQHGMKPIHVAFFAGDAEEAKEIISLGASSTTTTTYGATLADFVNFHAAEGRVDLARDLHQVLLAQHGIAEPLPRDRTEARARLVAAGYGSQAPRL